MAELSLTCPCGAVLKVPNEDEMAKAARQHPKTAHGMPLSEEEAREQVRQAIAAQSGEQV